jgi:hypothetical protein
MYASYIALYTYMTCERGYKVSPPFPFYFYNIVDFYHEFNVAVGA